MKTYTFDLGNKEAGLTSKEDPTIKATISGPSDYLNLVLQFGLQLPRDSSISWTVPPGKSKLQLTLMRDDAIFRGCLPTVSFIANTPVNLETPEQKQVTRLPEIFSKWEAIDRRDDYSRQYHPQWWTWEYSIETTTGGTIEAKVDSIFLFMLLSSAVLTTDEDVRPTIVANAEKAYDLLAEIRSKTEEVEKLLNSVTTTTTTIT